MVEDSTAFSAKDHFAKVFSKVPPTAILPVLYANLNRNGLPAKKA